MNNHRGYLTAGGAVAGAGILTVSLLVAPPGADAARSEVRAVELTSAVLPSTTPSVAAALEKFVTAGLPLSGVRIADIAGPLAKRQQANAAAAATPADLEQTLNIIASAAGAAIVAPFVLAFLGTAVVVSALQTLLPESPRADFAAYALSLAIGIPAFAVAAIIAAPIAIVAVPVLAVASLGLRLLQSRGAPGVVALMRERTSGDAPTGAPAPESAQATAPRSVTPTDAAIHSLPALRARITSPIRRVVPEGLVVDRAEPSARAVIPGPKTKLRQALHRPAVRDSAGTSVRIREALHRAVASGHTLRAAGGGHTLRTPKIDGASRAKLSPRKG